MAVRKRRRLGIGPASRGTKIDAWMRSSGTDARDSEPSTKNSVLIERLHSTPWFSGSATVPNSACGRSASKPNRPVHEDVGVGRDKRGQEQRVAPDEDAGDHAERRAPAIGAAPDQPADQRRRELRDGREGHQADRDEARAVGALAVVEEGDEQQDEDRAAPHVEDQRRPVLGLARSRS